MNNVELFGAILGDVDLARRITDYLAGCARIPSRDELVRVRGVGEATADKILACCELSARYVVGTEAKEVISPDDVLSRLCDLKYESQEHFVVITLDSANHIIARHTITVGLANQTPAAPREVFRAAVLDNAVSIIVAHNHPSGSTEPSGEDMSITRLLVSAGEIMKIPVLDHIIISKSGYTSLCRLDPDMFKQGLSN